MKTTANTLTVTQDNLQAVLETTIIGNVATQSIETSQLLEDIMGAVIASGNSVFTLVQPTALKIGANMNYVYDEADFAHITDVTPFSVELENSAQVFELCQSAQGTFENLDAYLAVNPFNPATDA